MDASLPFSPRRNTGFRWIDQLYVLPGYERRGIGALHLALAHKTLQPPTRLDTFQANSGARAFL
jgi:hypothetical protein